MGNSISDDYAKVIEQRCSVKELGGDYGRIEHCRNFFTNETFCKDKISEVKASLSLLAVGDSRRLALAFTNEVLQADCSRVEAHLWNHKTNPTK